MPSRLKLLTSLSVIASATVIAAGGAVAAPADKDYQPLTHREVKELSSVSTATLAKVSNGKQPGAGFTPPNLAKLAPLTKHGKPEVAYIMADFCPFCAAENWSMAVALSRFGTLSGLTTLSSNPDDIYPDTRSVSFRYSHFHSKYVDYDPIVNEDENHKRIEKVPHKVAVEWKRAESGALGYPFVDFNGAALVTSPGYDPKVLKKLTRPEIAADLNHPNRGVTKAIDGTANEITAAICVATDNKPASVCATKTIATIRKHLKSAPHH